MAAGGEQGVSEGLEVGGVEPTFFCTGEDGNDATEPSGCSEEREEVLGEAEPGVVG